MSAPSTASELYRALDDRVGTRLFGMSEPLRLVVIGILTGSHVLIDDVPGVGKTTLVRLLAGSLGLTYKRVQFTPDLMPTDITGTSVLDRGTDSFQFRPGPVFAQVVLADEINRATPKTQAALLEAMQEHQVTVDGESYPLPEPFFVLATQNPIELEGTFPLPEAQLDRFLLRVRLGYPDEEHEQQILQVTSRNRDTPATPMDDLPSLEDLRALVDEVRIEEPVRRYVVSIAASSRAHPELAVGVSPRAVEQMGDAARAAAALEDRAFVIPDDVKALAAPVFTHRLVPTTDARIRERTAGEILTEILRSVPVPTEM